MGYYCEKCNAKVEEKEEICPECGEHFEFRKEKTNSIIIALLSLIPGLGHIYIGEIRKALTTFVITIVLLLTTTLISIFILRVVWSLNFEYLGVRILDITMFMTAILIIIIFYGIMVSSAHKSVKAINAGKIYTFEQEN